MPDGRPAFFCEVRAISRYGEREPRLGWAYGPKRWGVPDRYALMGEADGRIYACYPVHDGGALLAGEPDGIEVPRSLIEQVLDTFRTGVIHDETLAGLRQALERR